MSKSSQHPFRTSDADFLADDFSDVDLTQIRWNLSLTPAERLVQCERWARFLEIIDIDSLIATLRAGGLKKDLLMIEHLEILKKEREKNPSCIE